MNGNSSATLDLTMGNHNGMTNWTIDGVNQLLQQWFWYRIGPNSPQATIDTISAPANTLASPNVLYTVYQNSQFSIEVDYTLTGGAPGSGSAGINESIRVTNLTATSLDFHLYQFSHYKLGGVIGGATANLQKNLLGKFIDASESNGSIEYNETVATPGGDRGEANLSAAALLAELNGPAYLLNNNTTAGPGDVGYALEWDRTVLPNDGFVIGKAKSISPIPEPATLVLLPVAALALAAYRRRR